MTLKKRAAAVILALLLVLTGASGRSVYGAWRQAQKNSELIAAIKEPAFMQGDVAAIVETMLKQGADPNARDTTERLTFWQWVRDQVLHKAHQGAGTPALELAMLRYLVDVDRRLNKQDESILFALVKHGANPNIRDDNGMTPLIYACLCGNDLLVRLLLEHGADVNVKDIDGNTPLNLVVGHNDPDLVSLLKRYGATQ